MTTVTVTVPERPQATVDINDLPLDVAVLFAAILGTIPTNRFEIDWYKDWAKLMDAVEPYFKTYENLIDTYNKTLTVLREYMKEYK